MVSAKKSDKTNKFWHLVQVKSERKFRSITNRYRQLKSKN